MILGTRRLLFLALTVLGFVSAHADSQLDSAPNLTAILASGHHPLLGHGDFASDRAALLDLYARRDNEPLWYRNGRATAQGATLLDLLRDANVYGLDPEDYDATQLRELSRDLAANHGALIARQADVDLALSVSLVRLFRHLHFGRIDPKAVSFSLNAPHTPLDVAATLEALATTDDVAGVIRRVEPPFLHYELLKEALRRYETLARDYPSTELPPFHGRSVKIGEAYDGIPALRTLLIALGDLPADARTSDTILDATLAVGIQHFQQRHGLATDGALGGRTLAALRVPLADRVRQLALTLERWRWLPKFDAPPIIVNIPAFRLFGFRSFEDRAANTFRTDVIVGKTNAATRTPIFTAEAKYVVFRPYWDVPYSIAVKELLPEIRANPAYLDKNHYEIVSSTQADSPTFAPTPDILARVASGALRIRQRPGDDNALGLVKVMLPNPHNVYLHSTPAHRLFEQPRRTFSHGCIRVRDAVGLVEHVFRNEPAPDNEIWTRPMIEEAMHDESPGGNNRHVFLTKPIPVFIVYETAVALENGNVQFYEDIYGHDATLARLLREREARE